MSLFFMRQVDMVLFRTAGIGATGGGFWQISEYFGNSGPGDTSAEFATGDIVTVKYVYPCI
jgi:hypothetical protein